jgi:hypothetical protein
MAHRASRAIIVAGRVATAATGTGLVLLTGNRSSTCNLAKSVAHPQASFMAALATRFHQNGWREQPQNLPEEWAVVAQTRCLKDHFVGPLVAAQAETRRKVRLQVLDLPDIRHNSLVDLLLILYPLRIRLLLLCWLTLFEELLLALAVLLLPSPVLVLANPV